MVGGIALTQVEVVCRHVVRHGLCEPCVLRRRAQCILRQGHVANATIEVKNDRVLRRLCGQRARHYIRDALFPPPCLPCRDYVAAYQYMRQTRISGLLTARLRRAVVCECLIRVGRKLGVDERRCEGRESSCCQCLPYRVSKAHTEKSAALHTCQESVINSSQKRERRFCTSDEESFHRALSRSRSALRYAVTAREGKAHTQTNLQTYWFSTSPTHDARTGVTHTLSQLRT